MQLELGKISLLVLVGQIWSFTNNERHDFVAKNCDVSCKGGKKAMNNKLKGTLCSEVKERQHEA